MSRFFAVSLITILFFQLLHIEHAFPYPFAVTGKISERVAQDKIPPYQTHVRSAQLTISEQKKYSSMVMVGDVLLARNIEFLMNKNGGQYPFAGLDLQQFNTSSAIVGNFEAAVPVTHVPTDTGLIDFSVSEDALQYLSAAGYTHLSLGNNHSYDFGEQGFVNTVEKLEIDFNVFGEPDTLSEFSVEFVQVNEKTISIIGINALTPLNELELKKVVNFAAFSSDIAIAFVHWGEEYALRQNQSQRKLAGALVKLGVDIIVGHHPHVVQGVELIEGVPVFYSLGNYIFDQYFSKDVQEGLVLLFDFSDDTMISLLPVTSKYSLSQPRLMNLKSHSKFLESVAAKSDLLLRDSIIRGQLILGNEVATSSKIAMIDIN